MGKIERHEEDLKKSKFAEDFLIICRRLKKCRSFEEVFAEDFNFSKIEEDLRKI